MPLQQISMLTYPTVSHPTSHQHQGSDKITCIGTEDKTRQLTGPHKTSWVPSGAPTPKPASTPPHQSWMFLAAYLDFSKMGRPEGSETGQWELWENSTCSPLQTFSLPLFFLYYFLLEALFLLQGSLPAPGVLPLISYCQLTEQ